MVRFLLDAVPKCINGSEGILIEEDKIPSIIAAPYVPHLNIQDFRDVIISKYSLSKNRSFIKYFMVIHIQNIIEDYKYETVIDHYLYHNLTAYSSLHLKKRRYPFLLNDDTLCFVDIYIDNDLIIAETETSNILVKPEIERLVEQTITIID